VEVRDSHQWSKDVQLKCMTVQIIHNLLLEKYSSFSSLKKTTRTLLWPIIRAERHTANYTKPSVSLLSPRDTEPV